MMIVVVGTAESGKVEFCSQGNRGYTWASATASFMAWVDQVPHTNFSSTQWAA